MRRKKIGITVKGQAYGGDRGKCYILSALELGSQRGFIYVRMEEYCQQKVIRVESLYYAKYVERNSIKLKHGLKEVTGNIIVQESVRTLPDTLTRLNPAHAKCVGLIFKLRKDRLKDFAVMNVNMNGRKRVLEN